MVQHVQQLVVVDQDAMSYARGNSRVALFDESGNQVRPVSDKQTPINTLDPKYFKPHATDDTTMLQSALDDAFVTKRNLHFSRRPLGEPYIVSGSGVILKISPGVSITSDPNVVLKVKDNNGNYKTIFGGTGLNTDLSNLIIENLTIDQNSTGNPVSDVSSLLVEGTQRFCVYVGAGSNITVRQCKFKNVDGLNTLYIGSSSMKDVRVEDCEFDLVGSSPAWHDHSTIYLSCDGSTVSRNKFRGILGSNGATTAIETHGPNQDVSHNRVDGYKIGANITGITSIGNDGISVIQNVIRNVLIGIQLWSWNGTNGGLVDVDVSHNRIHINRDPWTLLATDHPKGICINQSASGSYTIEHIIGLRISNNTIRFGAFSISNPNDYSNGSGIELVSQVSTMEIRDLDLGYNLVVSALGPALRIGCKLIRAMIHKNRFVDPSSTSQSLGTPAGFTSFWRSGICATGNADFYDVKIQDNQTFDTRGTHLLAQAFATSLSTGQVTRCEEGKNTIVCYDGIVLPETNQTSTKRFDALGVPMGRRLKSGLYHTAQGGTPTTLALTAGNEYAIPFEVGSQQSFVEIAANITVVGSSGALLRFGLRADDGNGGPGTLLADFGTISSETLAARAITINKVFPAGTLWLTVTAQVAGCTVTAISGWLVGASGASSVAGAIGGRSSQYQTGVTGSLPNTFVSGGQTPNAPAVFVKAA